MADRMGILKICPYKDIQELKYFYCGIAEMDNFFHSSKGFDMSVRCHYCKAFVVKDVREEIVAVFALNFDSLVFDSDNLDDLFSGVLNGTPDIDSDYKDNFMSKSHHPALEITYLAVRKDKREQGIGEDLVGKIANAAQEQALAGCEFLTVGAYHNKEYSAVNFYNKCQFSILDLKHDTPDTTRMFRVLYPEKAEEM